MIEVDTKLEAELVALRREVRVGNVITLGGLMGLDMTDTVQVAKAVRFLAVVEHQVDGENRE